MTIRRRRSALYLPASNAKAIAKARTLPCDVVILDLEDAVAPDAKELAREQAVNAAREGFGERELVIRVNGLDTQWGEADLRAVARVPSMTVLAPKVNSASDVAAFAKLFPRAETKLWVMVETAISLFRLEEIASTAHAGPLSGFVMGTNDLAKEM